MKTTIAEFLLRQPSEAAELAQRAEVLATLTQLSPQKRAELAKAVDVVCRTIAAHGGRGRVRFSLLQNRQQRAIEVSVYDLPEQAETGRTNEAIEELPPPRTPPADSWEAAVLQRVGEMVDHFESSSWPLAGAVVRMSQILSPAFAFPSESEIASWAQMLQSNTALDALAHALQRARSLEKDLGDAKCQQQIRTGLGETATESDPLETLSLVLSRTKNAISILQPNGVITGINRAFSQMTGYAPQEVMGQPLAQSLFGPDSSPASVAAYEQALSHGEELTQDVLQYRKDGQTYWVESDLIPVRNKEGQLTRWIVINNDITKRRETEEALRSAKETAENHSRQKSEFLANMSHEIRTPLNAIIGMTDLALATDLTAQQHEYLQTVRTSGESLLLLLNDILDLSKIEAGKMEVEAIDFDLRQVIQESLRTLEIKAQQKGLLLATELADSLPRNVRGDSTKLRQVLLNLVGNAIKFTTNGSVTVSVSEQSRRDNSIVIHFQVRDTGPGIPREKLDEIFQAFRQGDTSTTRQFGGTGLGLTISSELVRLMQGRMWVDSMVGQGSTFHFTLPVQLGTPLALPPAGKNISDPQDQRDRQSVHKPDPIQPNWKEAPHVAPIHVLVADDHLANRRLVMEVLQERGHICTEAADGQQALSAWQEGEFDLLLMDVQMPIMDGYQATAAIRRLEETTRKHVPIIALTAHAMAGDREKCLAAGMDAYLAKPIRPQRLVEMVESVTALKPSPLAAQTAKKPSEDEVPGFDLNFALESLDHDTDLLTGQMEFLLQDAPSLMNQIHHSIEDQDASHLRLAAHRLKGMLGRYAYHDAVSIALQLEEAGAADQLSDTQTLASNLSHHVERLVTAVEGYLAEHR